MAYAVFMQQKNLKEIADVVSGYTFRTALEEDESGDTFVFQARDVTDVFDRDPRDLTQISFQGPRTSAMIRKDDVLVTARGYFKAGAIHLDMHNTIAASSVYVIRLRDATILPDYLAIYLNSEQCQKHLDIKTIGSTVSTLLKKDLEMLPILIPDVQTQEKLIALKKNIAKLRMLYFNKQLTVDLLFLGTLERLFTTK